MDGWTFDDEGSQQDDSTVFYRGAGELSINTCTGSCAYITRDGKILQRFFITKEIVKSMSETVVKPYERHSRFITEADVFKSGKFKEGGNGGNGGLFGALKKAERGADGQLLVPGASHCAQNALKLHYKRIARFY